MNIDPKRIIAGVPILKVRDTLRKAGAHEWSTEWLHERLALSRRAASRLIESLKEAGYVEATGDREFPWRCTPDGLRLADARGTKPVPRATAEQHLDMFLSRVRQVNASEEYAFTVRRVLLFGSYLTADTATVGDLDLAVELTPRGGNDDEQRQRSSARIRQALERGRSFRTFFEQVCWPQEEVMRILKGRSRVISLHPVEEVESRHWERRTVFEAVGRSDPLCAPVHPGR